MFGSKYNNKFKILFKLKRNKMDDNAFYYSAPASGFFHFQIHVSYGLRNCDFQGKIMLQHKVI